MDSVLGGEDGILERMTYLCIPKTCFPELNLPDHWFHLPQIFHASLLAIILCYHRA